jgi:hypothetical protein
MAYAYAFDVRAVRSGETVGVGVAVPAIKYVAFRAAGSKTVVSPALTDELWNELSLWAAYGDAALPAQPPPMTPRVVSAIVPETSPHSVVARRFAVMPVAEVLSRLLL